MKRTLTVISALLLALMLCPKSLADGAIETAAPIVCPSPAPGETQTPQANEPQPTGPLSGDTGQEPQPSTGAYVDTPPDGTEPTPAPENPHPSEPNTSPALAPSPAPEATPTSAAVPIKVTVNAPEFTIVIPDGIDFGTLNAGETAYSVPLEVGVKDVSGVSGGSIIVTLHGDFKLTDGTDEIPFSVYAPDGRELESGGNFCGFHHLSDGDSATKEGSLMIILSDIVPGSFAGSLSFTFTFMPDLAQAKENETNPEQPNVAEEALLP